MTTNNEALQKIFEAALKQPDPTPRSRPKPATPTGRISPTPNAVVESPTRRLVRPASTQVCIPESPKEAKHKTQALEAASPKTAVLDAKASDAMVSTLQKTMASQCRKQKTQKIITILVLIGSIAGSIAWFISSPERVRSLTASTKEIQPAAETTPIVAANPIEMVNHNAGADGDEAPMATHPSDSMTSTSARREGSPLTSDR